MKTLGTLCVLILTAILVYLGYNIYTNDIHLNFLISSPTSLMRKHR